jgi:chromate reductase
VPGAAVALHARVVAASAVLIASPEYNGGYTPLFKNTLDWLTRVETYVFYPRYVGLMTATDGRRAGARSLKQMSELLGNMGVQVHDPFGIGHARAMLEAGDPAPGVGDWAAGFVSAARAAAADPPVPPGG